MNIETVNDLSEQLADWFGIYGGCKSDGESGCLLSKEKPFCCRQGFVDVMNERIRDAVKNDLLLSTKNDADTTGKEKADIAFKPATQIINLATDIMLIVESCQQNGIGDGNTIRLIQQKLMESNCLLIGMPEASMAIVIYDNDKVNSLLSAALKFLSPDQLIVLRDCLIKRTPKI